MNRVKKISKAYEQAKPQIDHLRMIDTQTRRTRRAARKAKDLSDQLQRGRQHRLLQSLDVPTLRSRAKSLGVAAPSKMRKQALIDAITKLEG